MKKLFRLPLYLILLFLIGCGSSSSDKDKDDSEEAPGSSDMSSISSGEYKSLSSEKQYRVANQLAGTLFKGISVSSFFDLSTGISPLTVKEGIDYITQTRRLLSEELTDKNTYLGRVDAKYSFDESSYKPKQYPLALLFELPLSKDYYDHWMSYILTNTILFSPAFELETTDYIDIQKVYYRLSRMIGQGEKIRDIVYDHMISQENWRRFRSPEDNTREMMEIFLARFIDEEVPKAAKACQNWVLSDENQGYQLIIDFNENTESQNILDTSLTSCYEFYEAVSQHSDLIPVITKTIVDRFFLTHTDQEQQAITDQIVASNPTTFTEIFNIIIFSGAYLLENSRPKWYEEAFFNLANRINWFADENYFRYLNRPPGTYSSITTLAQMKQASMSYKLGRLTLPLDSLSFSYYHKSVRERLLVNRKSNPFSNSDSGWQSEFIEVDLMGEDFINYLFLSVISRQATKNELTVIQEILVERGYDDDSDDKMQQAMVVLDYLSRLSELYFFREI